MNSPSRVIAFVNAGHFIDHYSMLIFAAAVIVMGPALGMAYSELLPYATPGFVAFGAGSLITGWLGDRWSRRHMMVIFFAGIGLSMIAVGFVQTPLQLGAALLAIGMFASIYHPVGTAMIVSYAEKLGREMGINGVWGNLGVASSALVTGVIGAIFRLARRLHRSRHRHHRHRHRLCHDGGPRRPHRLQTGRGAGEGGEKGHVAGDPRAVHRCDRDLHHLQRGHRGAAKTVRRTAGRHDQKPGAAGRDRRRRLRVRRDDAIHHRQTDRPLFAESRVAAAVAAAGAVPVSWRRRCRTCR